MKPYIGIKVVNAEPETRSAVGYKVQYANGYESWSPKTVFEDAYFENGKLDFPRALWAVLNCHVGMRRPGRAGCFIYRAPVTNTSKEHLVIETPRAMGRFDPSQGDMTATDWEIVPLSSGSFRGIEAQ